MTTPHGDDPWDQHAAWWAREFTDGADPEYEEQILPMAEEELSGAGRVLDLGCGEGQVARRVARRGSTVVGVDRAYAQVAEATARGGGPGYVRGGAPDLPFADAAFDAVVACLVFEHIADVVSAIADVARVLRPSGRFCLFLNHPLLQTPGSSWIDDQIMDPPEQYWRVGPYLTEVSFDDEVEKGVFITFHHRPLGIYVNALAGVGLFVTKMAEPPPPPGFQARAEEYGTAAQIPRLLYLRAEPMS